MGLLMLSKKIKQMYKEINYESVYELNSVFQVVKTELFGGSSVQSNYTFVELAIE